MDSMYNKQTENWKLLKKIEYLGYKKMLEHQLQKSTVSAPHRHTFLIQRCRDAFLLQPPSTILSFGCSSGFEVQNLLELFPNLRQIVGVDINHLQLREAETKFTQEPRVFLHHTSDFTTLDPIDKKFDFITCFNVLCNHCANDREHPGPIDFDLFAQSVQELADCLNPHGVLCVYGANYALNSVSLSSEFVFKPLRIDSGPVPMYDKDGKTKLPRNSEQLFVVIRT